MWTERVLVLEPAVRAPSSRSGVEEQTRPDKFTGLLLAILTCAAPCVHRGFAAVSERFDRLEAKVATLTAVFTEPQ